ncbi:MAG: Lrp/AsnC family transcriptional regulator [Firmicutes bacterium]|nr:Lrp/AsnC family transcriptional regulator [Bacillota bacterium]
MKYPRKDLDETDYAILELLQSDGRLSLSELGRQIGMSPVAISDRIARMTDMGVIEGFTAVINKERMGLPTHAFIIAELVTPDKRREFDSIIESTPQITASYRIMSGGKEAILNVYCRDYDQLIELQNKLSRLTTYSTFIVEPQPRKKTIISNDTIRVSR